MLNWIVWNRTIFIKMDLALHNLQRLICHKTQATSQPITWCRLMLQWPTPISFKINTQKGQFNPNDLKQLKLTMIKKNCIILEKAWWSSWNLSKPKVIKQIWNISCVLLIFWLFSTRFDLKSSSEKFCENSFFLIVKDSFWNSWLL